ncbi:MAG: hypothetical protein JRF56_02775 [Deltaproteobacteria bacterium]|nr:hypothetical protein [Deltaproteobacteria bacterium]
MKISIVVTCIALLLFGFTAYAQTNWQLYDNFNSAQIDSSKWETDDSSATITVENGRAKFEHKSGFANDSSYLLLIKNPKTIIGIKATVTVESCSGDVRARMASFIGKIGDDYVYTAHEKRADRDYISSSLAVLSPSPDYAYKYDYFWGHFKNPLNYTGTPFTMSMILSREHAEYDVEGQGELEFSFPNELSPTDDFFKGIGTRSVSGNGTCTVYFDDVYIVRQPPTPAGNFLLLNE